MKASESSKNPPEVVSKNADSLYNTLLDLSKCSDRLMKALAKAFDKFGVDIYAALIGELLYDINTNNDLQNTRKKMLIVPFLLRTTTTYNNDDFGIFYTDPSEFEGTSINFYIMILDVPLGDFGDELYSRVRGEN